MTVISVIVGSTRLGRFSERPAEWILQHLKKAIDWVYPEWNRKVVGFVSYGSAMGARGVQQLRETAIELQLAPVRSSVHIPIPTLWAHYQGGDVDAGLAELEGAAARLIDDLLWWTEALKTARASTS